MHVSRESYEESVRRATEHVREPSAGLYGPGSMTWEIARESVLFLGGGCAALLQLAHPFVAHAVDQHSATRTDPLGRFQRTFQHVNAILFGDLEMVLSASRRVRHIHDHIRGPIREDVGAFHQGQTYEANDAPSLLWVHTTLIYTAVQVYELVVRPLTTQEREQYYAEAKCFAMLFGVPESELPPDWAAFSRYFDRMVHSDQIAVGGPAREMSAFLLTPARPSARPLMSWYKTMTSGLLPQTVREQLGWSFGRTEQAMFKASIRTLRAGYPRLPRRARDVPAYVEAQRRLQGRTGPDRLGRALERFVLRTVT